MRKWMKWPALGLSAAILVAAAVTGFSAPRRNRLAAPVPAVAEQATQQVPPFAAETPATAPVTASATEPSAEGPSTEAAPHKPETKAEVVEFFNQSVNQVKSDKPGYTWQDRVLIDRDAIECSNRALNAIAPSVLRIVQPIAKFGEWQKQDAVAKGASHSEFPVAGQSWASKLEPGFVKSFSCREFQGDYQITFLLADENAPVLPKDRTVLRTGRVMNVWDATMLEDAKMAEPFVTITSMAANYRNSSIACTIDIETGQLKSITYVIACILAVDVKQFGNARASLPFERHEQYFITS